MATQHNQAITLVVAANYGGRWDVVQAVKNWQMANPDDLPGVDPHEIGAGGITLQGHA